MEMVAAARLRRAEQRIESLRPYAQAIRELTRQVADAAPERVEGTPLLERREKVDDVAVLLITGDRGLAGSFNTQIIREGVRFKGELAAEGAAVHYSVVGRRGSSASTSPSTGTSRRSPSSGRSSTPTPSARWPAASGWSRC